MSFKDTPDHYYGQHYAHVLRQHQGANAHAFHAHAQTQDVAQDIEDSLRQLAHYNKVGLVMSQPKKLAPEYSTEYLRT